MISNLNTSDEGGCYRWIPLLEDQKLRERGVAVAFSILRDPQLADQVVQEVSMSIAKRPDADKIDGLQKYFLRSVKNRSLSMLTSAWYRLRVNSAPPVELEGEESEDALMQMPDPGCTPEMNLEYKEENKRMLRIVQSCSEDLNDREKELLRLHLKGYTPTEIANAWNEDVDEIQVQMNRILAKVRHRCRRKNKDEAGGK